MNGSAAAKRWLALLLVITLSGCSAMHRVDLERAVRSGPPSGLDYGSLVELRTLDGEKARFRVTELTPEGVGGAPGFYRYADLERLRVERNRQRGSGDALAIIGGLLGVAALIWLIGNSDDVRVCSPGPCPTPDP